MAIPPLVNRLDRVDIKLGAAADDLDHLFDVSIVAELADGFAQLCLKSSPVGPDLPSEAITRQGHGTVSRTERRHSRAQCHQSCPNLIGDPAAAPDLAWAHGYAASSIAMPSVELTTLGRTAPAAANPRVFAWRSRCIRIRRHGHSAPTQATR